MLENCSGFTNEQSLQGRAFSRDLTDQKAKSPLFPGDGGGGGKSMITNNWCINRRQYASSIVKMYSLTSLHSSTVKMHSLTSLQSSTYFIFDLYLYLHHTGSRTRRATYKLVHENSYTFQLPASPEHYISIFKYVFPCTGRDVLLNLQ